MGNTPAEELRQVVVPQLEDLLRTLQGDERRCAKRAAIRFRDAKNVLFHTPGQQARARALIRESKMLEVAAARLQRQMADVMLLLGQVREDATRFTLREINDRVMTITRQATASLSPAAYHARLAFQTLRRAAIGANVEETVRESADEEEDLMGDGQTLDDAVTASLDALLQEQHLTLQAEMPAAGSGGPTGNPIRALSGAPALVDLLVSPEAQCIAADEEAMLMHEINALPVVVPNKKV